MSSTIDDLCHHLEVGLCRARLEHLDARCRLRMHDTAENREAEARCCAEIDVLLALLLELRGTERRIPRGTP